MDYRTGPWTSRPFRPPTIGVGARLTLWVVVVFAITLIVFVGLDVYHESQFAESEPLGRKGPLFC